MPPRTILYTGKGGTGTTSVAAATARRCAAAGLRAIVVSTGPSPALGDVLGAAVGPDPREIDAGLRAQEVCAQHELERHWPAVRDWLGAVLGSPAADRVSAEELTAPPGSDALFALLAIEGHWTAGEVDVIVVDAGATGEALRLLSAPDIARWWLERVFPGRSRIVDAGQPVTGDAAAGDGRDLARRLVATNEILADHAHTSVRVVMTPDGPAAREARAALTGLRLYDRHADAVVVNRVLPEATGPYFAERRAREAEHLEQAHAGLAPVPVLSAPDLPDGVAGPEALDRLGDALFEGRDAAATLCASRPQELTVTRTDARLRFDLPFARPEDVVLRQVGLALVVRVDGRQRTIALPPTLADYRPAGATVRDGALHVRFDRDPAAASTDA